MRVQNLKFILQASIAAFGAYFCMYAFRKPFTVATFSELIFLGVDYKIWLVIAQVLGYTISKFLGIKLIAEMPTGKRFIYLLSFILFAELALLGFALVSAPYNIIFLFLNGLPLGMIWGIVFSYLEGRKTTEILGVILCSSFIISSGVVKSIGKLVMDFWNFSEFWMPFVTGLLFIIPLVLFALLLERLPKPTKQDEQKKSKRAPLNQTERIKLYKEFALPLTLIIIFYVFLTGVRDFRDNFAREIWDALGFTNSVSIYSFSEIPIAISVLVIMVFIGSINKNFIAFAWYHLVLCLGGLLIGVSTILFQIDIINPVLWMIISGFGMYVCYIPFQGLFFDRMIATFKIKGNVGFLIYIADAFGYLGSVMILLYKNFGKANISYLNFFTYLILIVAVLAVSTSILSYAFFKNKEQKILIQQNILIHE
ncbi:DUF5690 family protein [Algibacter sp. PT7-4]|uniref:DUF5690 family protein n=1 Tax=Algibacter ulvanivorans TaxID=3400999 RepID=UPI003AAED7AE